MIHSDTGGITFYGRSDAVLKPSGVRIGTAEIYTQMEKIAEIADSLAVGQNWQGDQRVILFVKLSPGLVLDRRAAKIKSARPCGRTPLPAMFPPMILEMPDIPYTLNMKKVESAVTNITQWSARGEPGCPVQPILPGILSTGGGDPTHRQKALALAGNCCEITDRAFSAEEARNEGAQLPPKGSIRSNARLLRAIRRLDIRNASVLDIGGGIGAIHHELLGDVAETAIHVDASSAYLKEAPPKPPAEIIQGASPLFTPTLRMWLTGSPTWTSSLWIG